MVPEYRILTADPVNQFSVYDWIYSSCTSKHNPLILGCFVCIWCTEHVPCPYIIEHTPCGYPTEHIPCICHKTHSF